MALGRDGGTVDQDNSSEREKEGQIWVYFGGQGGRTQTE